MPFRLYRAFGYLHGIGYESSERDEPFHLHKRLLDLNFGTILVSFRVDNLGHIVQPGIDEHRNQAKPSVGIIQAGKPLGTLDLSHRVDSIGLGRCLHQIVAGATDVLRLGEGAGFR